MELSFVVAAPDVQGTDATAYKGPISPFFKKLKELGYRGVELMVRNPKELDFVELQAWLRDNDLEVALVNTGRVALEDDLHLMKPPGAERDRARDRICEIIDFAAAISQPPPHPFGPQINAGLLRGQVHSGQDAGAARGWVVENLRYVAEYAARCGVRIALEPINRYQSNFVNTAEEAVDLAREVGTGNIGIQMDVFHMNIEERSLAGSLIRNRDWITHIHVCDTNRRAPGQGHLATRGTSRPSWT